MVSRQCGVDAERITAALEWTRGSLSLNSLLRQVSTDICPARHGSKMTDERQQLFEADLASAGHQRLARLVDQVEPDALPDGSALHRLSRSLETGFRAPVREILSTFDRSKAWLDALEACPRRWWFIREDFEIVVTGFGPFQKHASNPSKPFAKAAAAALSAGFSASYEGLSVTYREVDEFVDLYDYDSQPLLIHCGLSAERDHIALERFAHNVRNQTTDNAGDVGTDEWVLPGGPAALESYLPLGALADEMSGRLAELDLGASVSRDAGAYVCNALYYRSLLAVRRARLAGRAAEASFVHVPALDDDRARRAGRRVGEALGDFLETSLGGQFV